MRYKISVVGHFGLGQILNNGQTIKTKIITTELERHFGQEQILKIDTCGRWRTLFKSPFHVFKALKNSKNILIFPATNGLRIYAPLLYFIKKLFRKRKLHYIVIGGWLPFFLNKRRFLSFVLKHFDHIYVETQTIKLALEKQGFSNVLIMANCKNLEILSENKLIYPNGIPYKLCTFSRVMKEKGIETAVNVVRAVNEKIGFVAYCLDIYGQIDQYQLNWFDNIKKNFPDYIHYCGCVNPSQSVEVLKNYFALLFPTHFYTEGIPGTIIDAFAAGIPVISSKWESYSDIIDENTGLCYTFNSVSNLEDILLKILNDPTIIVHMKENCLSKATNYTPSVAIQTLIERLN